MNSLRRVMVFGAMVGTLAAPGTGSGPARAAGGATRPAEVMVLEVPAAVAIRRVEAESLTAGPDRMLQAEGPTTIELADGVRLITREARVTLALGGAHGAHRIFVEALPGAAIEMVTPTGTLRTTSGRPVIYPDHRRPTEWYGSRDHDLVTVGLADDVRLTARFSRVIFVDTERDHATHVTVEPLHTPPAET